MHLLWMIEFGLQEENLGEMLSLLKCKWFLKYFEKHVLLTYLGGVFCCWFGVFLNFVLVWFFFFSPFPACSCPFEGSGIGNWTFSYLQSENHRTIWVKKDLKVHSVPTPNHFYHLHVCILLSLLPLLWLSHIILSPESIETIWIPSRALQDLIRNTMRWTEKPFQPFPENRITVKSHLGLVVLVGFIGETQDSRMQHYHEHHQSHPRGALWTPATVPTHMNKELWKPR